MMPRQGAHADGSRKQAVQRLQSLLRPTAFILIGGGVVWLGTYALDMLPPGWPLVAVENVRGAGTLLVSGSLLGAFAYWEEGF